MCYNITNEILTFLEPELTGTSYEIDIAENNGDIWNDRDYKFKNLPDYLEGAIVAKIPVRLDQEATIQIVVHEPTTIYIVHEQSRSGGFETSLPEDGWTLLDDDLPNTFSLGRNNYAWEKKITASGTTTLTLPARTKETVCSILFRNNKL